MYPAGYALRLPRFKRIRWDLDPAEVDTLERVERLYEEQGRGRGVASSRRLPVFRSTRPPLFRSTRVSLPPFDRTVRSASLPREHLYQNILRRVQNERSDRRRRWTRRRARAVRPDTSSRRTNASDVRTPATLGNDTRYEALRLIAGADEAVCVCKLEPALGVSQGAVSQALSRLFGAGLVERRKKGRWRYYSATEPAERLLETLDETRILEDE